MSAPLPTVTCPVFGSASPPPAPSTAGLAPMLALASTALAQACRADARCLTPARVITKGGRPREITAAQVKQLAHGIGAGLSTTVAARRAGMSKATSLRILSGQHWLSGHPLIAPLIAAPTKLPRSLRHSQAVQNPTKNPTRADQTQGAGVVATRPRNAPKAVILKTGFEAALSAAESEAA